MKEKCYICCDLKSFYASVECVERGLDPLTTNLVVADKRRTEKTICLAVTPSLKAYGISGRARLFEVVQRVGEVNAQRRRRAPGRQFSGSSWHDPEVQQNPALALDYLVAPPRMADYIGWSTRVYEIYLNYVAPQDIHVYSIDEVFIDATGYLDTYRMTGRELARKMILDIQRTLGLTAAAGIGTNLYLAKVAMDIEAKHVPADEYGVRIAELDELSYRRNLWTHRPLTDFWRIGRGYAAKLEAHGLYTMGDIARCSIGRPEEVYNEELLYRLFGVNAELLIDHAWGWEPCTIADVKAYKPENKSIVSGQVLQCPYAFDKARLVVREMADALALDLVDKGLVTDQLVLTVGYDIENLSNPTRREAYAGPVTTDPYGRKIPKHGHGTANLEGYTSSATDLMEAVSRVYDQVVDRSLLIRRLSISANHLLDEISAREKEMPEQLDLFTDYAARKRQAEKREAAHAKERRLQETVLGLKKKYGKNAILKGMNLEEGATAKDQNEKIGGHQA
ncbi:MAG TPA: DNA methylase [Firmicutes bacterium]|nr:DNA methylase [Bacillota bacterium]